MKKILPLSLAGILIILALSALFLVDFSSDEKDEEVVTLPVTEPEKPVIPQEDTVEKPEEKIPEKPLLDKSPKQIVSIARDKVHSIEIDSRGEKLLIQKEESLWTINKNNSLWIDYSKVDDILKEILEISSLETSGIIQNSDESEQWGIDSSSHKINFITADQTLTMYLGKAAPGNKGYYLQIAGQKEIYMIKNSTASALQIKLDDIRDRKLSLFDKNQIASMIVDNGSLIKMVPYRQFDMFTADTYSFMLEEPYKAWIPVGTTELQSFLNSIGPQLTIENFIDSGAPSDFGLETGARRITVTEKSGKTFELLIGRDVNQSLVYGKLKEDKQIFTLKKKDLPFLNLEAFDLADKYPHLIAREKIDSFSISTEEFAVLCDIERRNGRNLYLVNGLDTDEESFNKIFDRIQNIRMTGELTEEQDYSRADITVSYKLKDGGSEWTILKFFKDGNSYAISKNDDEPLFVTSAVKVEETIDEITVLVDKIMGF